MQSRTDWAKVAAANQAELDKKTPAKPDDWMADASGVLTKGAPVYLNKQRINIRLDPEILAFFRAGGPGWQSRINEVLRTFVQHASRPGALGTRPAERD
jgi:uncharacterized protein (DUF4415 family)